MNGIVAHVPGDHFSVACPSMDQGISFRNSGLKLLTEEARALGFGSRNGVVPPISGKRDRHPVVVEYPSLEQKNNEWCRVLALQDGKPLHRAAPLEGLRSHRGGWAK